MTDPRVLVVGAGMAGLCAAVAAAEDGACVTVLDKARSVGGSMILSGGLLWTYPSMNTIERLVPHGDPALQEMVCEELVDATDWLGAQGVEIGREVHMPHGGVGREIAPPQVVEALTARLDQLGTVAELDTGLDALVTDASGAVTGVDALTGRRAAMRVRFDADAVILATGGFQGDAELVRRYLGIPPENVQLRANRWSTGDGLSAALRVGAVVTPGLSTFYGHALAGPPATFPPMTFREASQYYGAEAIALNMSGQRFVDEAAGTGEEHVNAVLAHQRGGRGFYVVNAQIAASTTILELNVQTIIDRARDFGAPYVRAESLEELCDRLGDLGVSSANALQTLTSYNSAVLSGRQIDLDPPRSGDGVLLQDPPFQAVGVQAALTFTMGGLAVDGRMRALSHARSTSLLNGAVEGAADESSAPIDGLFAAGCDLGGVSYGGYMGGLATALVTGRAAGRSATSLAAVAA